MTHENEKERATESLVVRLNADDFSIMKAFAFSKRISLSKAVVFVLAENKCFDYNVSDKEYNDLLNMPEMSKYITQRIPCSERNIIRYWITKQERKSLTYFAIKNHGVSPTVLATNIVRKILENYSQETEPNTDDLIRNLWEKASDNVKKELIGKYLKAF